jgi:glycosyltransferase involved in cell wall biosynthesis
MNISIIGSRGYPYIYSGYETFVKELSERLVNNGINVTVYCHKNLFNSRPKEVNGIRLKYFYSPQTKSFSQLINSFQAILHACFQKNNIILVVNSANGPLGLISKLAGKRTAINVDGLEWLRPKWRGLGAKYFYWASKMATHLYDVIINDSDSMKNIYLKEFNKNSIVIAYGANIRHSKNPKLINKWNLKHRNYYLIVGRLIPDNNADLIIKEFIKSNTDKKLVIVGDVPYKDSYASNIKKNKDSRLLFTGYVTDQDELAELYHNCYAYFHGHEFGGTNPTMLKALAYGCAILALDTVFNKEMLKDWEYGIRFTKAEGNLKKLIDFVDSQKNQMETLRQKSRNRIIENYTWEKITEQYINLFEEMNK